MIIIIMGVTGAGKTTVGTLLAKQLGWQFADADSFHSASNIEKMSHGIPLTDADRAPWLAAMRKDIESWILKGQNAVLGCSALKRTYRAELYVGPGVKFVFLKGTYDLIRERLQSRHGHFANEDILADQFEKLEEPQNVVTIDISKSPEEIVKEIRTCLNLF